MLNYKKRIWMIRQYYKGIAITNICKAQKVSRQAFYNLNHAYQKQGLSALQDKPKGRKVDQIPVQVQNKILILRKQNNGIKRISGLLAQKGVEISKEKITRVIKGNNLYIAEPKKGKRYKYLKWERKHSNSLWQTDFCWIERLECWLTAWLDDHSRLITSAEYLTEATTNNAISLFEKGIKKWGLPRETLSDRGTQYYPNLGETSRFLEYMKSKGVNHIYASIKKPTTCGKLERWWRTHNIERWDFPSLKAFVNHYNFKRPHMSLGYLTPFKVWKRDLKV